MQKGRLGVVADWLPEEVCVRLRGGRFYGAPARIGHCQPLGWDCWLWLKGSVRFWIDGAHAGPVERLARDTPWLTGMELTARRMRTTIGSVQRPGHAEPCEIAERLARGHRHVRGSELPCHA